MIGDDEVSGLVDCLLQDWLSKIIGQEDSLNRLCLRFFTNTSSPPVSDVYL